MLILGALFAAVAIIAAALSVDIGALVLSKRSNQRIADLASLDGVRGLTAAAPQRDDVERIAIASAQRNGFAIDPATATRRCSALTDTGATYTTPDGARWMKIEIGKYTTGTANNFVAVNCPAAAVLEALFPVTADAVRVTVSSPVSFNFMPGGGRETASAVGKLGTTSPTTTVPAPTTTTTTAPPVTIPGTEQGGARVGSRMASINTTQATVLNTLLSQANNPAGGLLGSPPAALNVSAVGYQGLAGLGMSISELATELGISAGTVDQVLNANFTYSDLIDAMILIADRHNQDAVSLTLQNIRSYTIPLDYDARHQTITLDDFTGSAGLTGGGQTFNGSSVAQGSLNVLELVRGGAVMADGDHLLSVPLSASTSGLLPTGVTAATANIQVIEAPQYKYGLLPPNQTARTAQLRTTLTLTVPVSIGALGLVNINIPVDIQGGGADATAQSPLGCNAAHDTALSELISIVTRAISGQTLSWSASALAGVVTISSSPGSVVSAAGSSTSHTFPAPFTDVQTVTPPSLGTLAINSSMISVGGVLPLGTTVSSVTSTIVSAINPVLANLNSTVMGPLYNALGVGFGGADYSVTQPDGTKVPVCTPATTATTTTTAPAPTTTTTSAPAPSGSYSGVPLLVD